MLIALAACAACAVYATPAAAEGRDAGWFLKANVGPAFGTLGSTPAADASTGYRFSRHLSLGAEFGMLPDAPFDKAGRLAPSAAALIDPSNLHVDSYHVNANLFMQPTAWGRLQPYATLGVGSFTSSTVANVTSGGPVVVQYERRTDAAENVGAGATFRIADWLGIGADYRHFVVNTSDTEHVNRFTTGITFLLK
jgi:hypothetical protein